MKYKCLSIAGFDASGGAGIQADLKTFSALGCYGMTVLTALPIQNTCGVRNCYAIPLSIIREQLECLFDDVIPDCIKIGMLFSHEIIDLIATFLGKHARSIPIVLDPVMVATSGDLLLLPDAISILKSKLIPLSTIITPNLPEAYTLVGQSTDFDALGRALLGLGVKAVLLKGGHANGSTCYDLFLDCSGNKVLLTAPRISTKNTHGTGCTLSSAICAHLARGENLLDACRYAKSYLHAAIESAKGISIGEGRGPVNHFYKMGS